MMRAPQRAADRRSNGRRGKLRAIERLKPQDMMLLWPEDTGWPQDIGVLAFLEPGRLQSDDGKFDIAEARRHIESRLHLLPRFRQRMLRPPLGSGWPLWADAADFEVADHVGVMNVHPPGEEPQVLQAAEQLRRRPFDRSRPLWTMTFLTGIAGDRIGFFMKLHHSIADGISGVAALGTLVDATARPPTASPVAWKPQPPPTDRDIFIDNVRRRLAGFARFLSKLTRMPRLGDLRQYWPTIHETFFERRAPRTSFNQRIGPDRSLAVIHGDLELARTTAHGEEAKVNDVLLAAVAGGYRELMRGRGEGVEGVTLRAFVPVSLHANGSAKGNLDGGMVIPLPAGEGDPRQRLRMIAAETTVRKKRARPQAGAIFRNVVLQRGFLALMPRQRMINAYVANVPGPPIPLYFAGSRILALFPIVPITGNIAIGVGALSYAGQFNLTVVADRDGVPDIEAFVTGTQQALQALTSAATQRS